MTRIEKREAELQASSLDALKELCGESFFAMTLQHVRKSGHPDAAISALQSTSWWEFKHATPRFKSPGIQEYTCVRLSHRSYCRYVIYFEEGAIRKTLIVRPEALAGCKGRVERIESIEHTFEGHDFAAVAVCIQQVHTTRRIARIGAPA